MLYLHHLSRPLSNKAISRNAKANYVLFNGSLLLYQLMWTYLFGLAVSNLTTKSSIRPFDWPTVRLRRDWPRLRRDWPRLRRDRPRLRRDWPRLRRD